MSLAVGWHFLTDEDPGPVLGAATFLDVGGSSVGLESAERLCRPYFTGRPHPAEIAQKARGWDLLGCRVVVANEPNLPQEAFGGPAAVFGSWFSDVALLAPGARLYYPGMSPGLPDWRDWYTDPSCRGAVADAHGLCVHAYGTGAQMRGIVEFLSAEYPHKPLWLSEVNFGAGQEVDRDRWADEHLRPFLDWCSTQPLIEAVTYFAHRWPTPDMHLPTPVDGAGTAIERVLCAWRPPAIPSQRPPADVPKPIIAPQPTIPVETSQESPAITALRDRTWALAVEWQAAGHPWMSQGLKALTSLSKNPGPER